MIWEMIYIFNRDDMSKYVINQDSIFSIPTGLRKFSLKSKSIVRLLFLNFFHTSHRLFWTAAQKEPMFVVITDVLNPEALKRNCHPFFAQQMEAPELMEPENGG